MDHFSWLSQIFRCLFANTQKLLKMNLCFQKIHKNEYFFGQNDPQNGKGFWGFSGVPLSKPNLSTAPPGQSLQLNRCTLGSVYSISGLATPVTKPEVSDAIFLL